MSSMTLTKRIEASPETVFSIATDFANLSENISGIVGVEMLSDGPVGVGTRFKETRVMFKKETTEEFEVTRFEPNKTHTIETTTCGSRYVCLHQFVPDGNGTILELTMDMQPQTFFAKLMSPLSKLMAGTMRKCIDKDLDDIKAAAEGIV